MPEKTSILIVDDMEGTRTVLHEFLQMRFEGEFKEAAGLSILPEKVPTVSFKEVSAHASFAVKGETPRFEEVRIEVGMSALYPSGQTIPATYGLKWPLGVETPSAGPSVKKEKDNK